MDLMSARRGLMSMSFNKDITEITMLCGLNPSVQDCLLPNSIRVLTLEAKNKASYVGGRTPSYFLSMFDNDSNIQKIIIDYGERKPSNVNDSFRSSSRLPSLKRVSFNVDTSKATGWDRFLYYTLPNVIHGFEIDGKPIDFSKMTRWNSVLNFDGLKEIRFVPNCISVSDVSIENQYTEEYSTETWISLVNALKSGQNGTFNIGAAATEKISSISGFDSSGIFVFDQSGSISLMDFATTVKGWSVV